MKIVKYKCDLCRTEKERDKLLAYFWKSDVLPQRYVVTHNLDSCDTHICKECFHTVKNTIDSEIK